MALRGPRLEFAVGTFLLLALVSLLVLAFASTNRQFGRSDGYSLVAHFSTLGQLRLQAPVRIGGVAVGRVTKIDLDPTSFDAVVTLDIDKRYQLSADTSAGIFTSGLLGESYIGLQPGGDPDVLQPGEEIAYTQPAVDLIQLAGKYMFGGGSGDAAPAASAPSSTEDVTP
jgi:phospholipid/cholesterol/gamma-HCH transport system substrate-binding protein